MASKIRKTSLFFLNQRFAIRFHDLFKEIYNPTTITESGRAGRQQLIKQFEQLVTYMESELHQELLAVSLRVEQLLKGLLKTNQLEMIEKAKRFDLFFQYQSGISPALIHLI